MWPLRRALIGRCPFTQVCGWQAPLLAGHVLNPVDWLCYAMQTDIRRSTSLSGHVAGADAQDRRQKRIRVVVLGSGWGACSFLKAMKKTDAEVCSADNDKQSAES